MSLLHRLTLALAVLRGGDVVIMVDVAFIVAGRRTLAQAPATVRGQTTAALATLGITE